MPYNRRWRRHRLPNRRKHLQVVNVFAHAQAPLLPVSQAPADRLLDAMSPITFGQAIPLVEERVTPDVDPDVRDVD